MLLAARRAWACQADEARFGSDAESGEDTIQIAGIEKFCNDIGVEVTDPIVLLIAWQMKAATMCVFTREEWTRGFVEIGVDSIDGLVRCCARPPYHLSGLRCTSAELGTRLPCLGRKGALTI